MREIRLYGSEGGGAVGSSYPYKVAHSASCGYAVRLSPKARVAGDIDSLYVFPKSHGHETSIPEKIAAHSKVKTMFLDIRPIFVFIPFKFHEFELK